MLAPRQILDPHQPTPSSVYSRDTDDFRVPWLIRQCSFLTIPINNYENFLAFLNLYQDFRYQFIPKFSLSYSKFLIQGSHEFWVERPHTIFTMLTQPKVFQCTFNFHEFLSSCKKSIYFSLLFLRYD